MQRPAFFKWSSLLFFSSLLHTAAAQYNANDFTRYAVKEGLTDSRITCLQQDDEGYLWIGTETGLNRFDGVSFKNYYGGDGPLNLPSGFITRLKNYGRHQLGIITRGGFVVLHTNNYNVQRYIMEDSTAFTTPLNAVWDAVPLKNGSYAITTAAGFYVINARKKFVLRHDAYSVNDIGVQRILYGRDIFSGNGGRYLVYTNEDGQALFDENQNQFSELTHADTAWKPYLNRGPSQYWVTKRQLNQNEAFFIPLHTDSLFYYNRAQNKTIASHLPFAVSQEINWLSTIAPVNDSVFLLNSATTGFYRFTLHRGTGKVSCDGKKYLSGYEILSLLTDKDGRLWVGTTEGLLKQELTPPLIQSFHYPNTRGREGRHVFSAVYRYKDVLYVGHYSRKGGLSLFDVNTMKVKRAVKFVAGESPWNEILSLEMYHPDTLWVGTWGGILWYDVKSGKYGKAVDEKKNGWARDFHAVLSKPHNGYAWMLSFLDGKVVRYHLASRTFTLFTSGTIPALPFDKIKNFAFDSDGDLWVGGHALARWNQRQQKFDTLIKVYGGTNKFNENIVALAADDQGSLWIHNADNGLLEYRIREKKFIAYTMKDGLPSNALAAMGPVVNENLWMAANNQLCLLNTRTKQFTVYDHHDGLPEKTPSGRRIYYDSTSGLCYLCNQDYLTQFPLTPPKKEDNSSVLRMEEMVINNERSLFTPDNKTEVSHSENNLRFDFTVIDFEKSVYQFAYRLNGGGWNSIGNQRSLHFNNLAPGEYTLEIKASGNPGVEKIKKLFFMVHPPFWQTAPFIFLLSIAFVATVYFLFRSRIRRIRQRAELDRHLSQTEMKALQAQMNPHFIFNSLNSIREMILTHENKEASRYLSKFAHLIRLTLDQSSQVQVSLRSTIDYLNRYMEMETIRNSQFTYQVILDDALDIDETFVSPMLLQPFIENAIWHGVTAHKKNIHVQVSFTKKADQLICTIDDNGVGIGQARKSNALNGSGHQSHGIANIQNRIKLLNERYHLHCSIQISDKDEITNGAQTGTLVHLQLPIQIKEI